MGVMARPHCIDLLLNAQASHVCRTLSPFFRDVAVAVTLPLAPDNAMRSAADAVRRLDGFALSLMEAGDLIRAPWLSGVMRCRS